MAERANDLGAYIERYTTRLDEVLERETLTSDLNINGDLLGEFRGAGKIDIATIAMDGLADYSRTGGFARGAVTTDWETYTLRYDRGREFEIDYLDDEERDAIVSANVMNEFARTKVVPEVDAIRFATLAQNAGKTGTGTISDASDALEAVLAMEEYMEDLGVPLGQVILYCTSHMKTLLRQADTRRFSTDMPHPNTNILTFDEMKIVTVPSARFMTNIDLNDGTTTGEEEGGFEKASDGKGIQFLAVDPRAAQAITKHETLRYFAPNVNQTKDAHKWQYRLFHDLLVYEQKKPLIYLFPAGE